MSITATAHHDGTGTLEIDGVRHQVQASCLAEARAEILRLATDEARKAGTPLRIIAREPDGEWPVLVNPDGHISTDDQTNREHTGNAAGHGRRSDWPPAPGAKAIPAVAPRTIGPSFLPEPTHEVEPRTGWRG